jgi:hypothetical protein
LNLSFCVDLLDFGGIGVHDPVKIARNQFETSKKATSCLSKAIQDGTVLDLNLHEETVRRTIKEKNATNVFFEG